MVEAAAQRVAFSKTYGRLTLKISEGSGQRGVGGITKGQAVTYALSDGKKIQKVTEIVAGTGSVVRAVSFLHGGSLLQQSPDKARAPTSLAKRGGGKDPC